MGVAPRTLRIPGALPPGPSAYPIVAALAVATAAAQGRPGRGAAGVTTSTTATTANITAAISALGMCGGPGGIAPQGYVGVRGAALAWAFQYRGYLYIEGIAIYRMWFC